MKITTEINQEDLNKYLLEMFRELLPKADIKSNDIRIQCKSIHNYMMEWEDALIRVTLDHRT